MPDLICYCFGYSREDIRQDLISNGQSLILKRILQEKMMGTCQCALKNPKGRWCTGDVRRVVDNIKAELAQFSSDPNILDSF